MEEQINNELNQLWKAFCKNYGDKLKTFGLPLKDIERLIIKKSVIARDMHAIYPYATYVNQLSRCIYQSYVNQQDNDDIKEMHENWKQIIQLRNEHPIIVKHHQRLDGQCDFPHSLALLEGEDTSFDDVKVFDQEDEHERKQITTAVDKIGRLALGHSFAHLPIVDDLILDSLLGAKDSTWLIARSKNGAIVGYCWGMLLRDIPVSSLGLISGECQTTVKTGSRSG